GGRAGGGELADGSHRTRSSPDGKPIVGCMRNALADAGLEPEDIDYINAHGTGTPENDKMECQCVTTVFGDHAKKMPISSNKSMIGHTLSAAGAIEANVKRITPSNPRNSPLTNYKDHPQKYLAQAGPHTARDRSKSKRPS